MTCLEQSKTVPVAVYDEKQQKILFLNIDCTPFPKGRVKLFVDLPLWGGFMILNIKETKLCKKLI
ncbi:MAG: hypothetical protein CME65_16240 [Halobacteriovoraceae bacterium]|nr:hypothetical protein [Halobacteriovoraceae bacterium]